MNHLYEIVIHAWMSDDHLREFPVTAGGTSDAWESGDRVATVVSWDLYRTCWEPAGTEPLPGL